MLCALWAGGCSLKPYKIDIQQGNVVTQEMVSKLRQGMTRSQVKFVMGTPLVADPFHPERWDYFYKFDKGGQAREERRLTLLFEADKLSRVLGDVNVAPGLDTPAAAGEARK
jgi:outer membrane protein assembly factor BamE